MAGPIWAEGIVELDKSLPPAFNLVRRADAQATEQRLSGDRRASGRHGMTTRRNFLKGAAGMAFCSCGLLDAARAQQPAQARLPVMVDGKRVKTIDVHAHCLFHEAVDLMGEAARSVRPETKGSDQMFIAMEERLRAMDAMAIDMEVLSINPFWYRKDRDTAAQIIKMQNEKLAEL
jgi:aminocarboxymuconate-semialdehyde decarboxylase